MTKYRKKPVVIEAVQFDGTPGSAVAVFEMFDIPGGKVVPNYHDLRSVVLTIPTLEGEMQASATDWIIKGVAGEIYPCKDHIFAKTYELVLTNEKDAPIVTPQAPSRVKHAMDGEMSNESLRLRLVALEAERDEARELVRMASGFEGRYDDKINLFHAIWRWDA